MLQPPQQQKSKTAEIIADVIWENQRGSSLFGKAKYSARSLLPTDFSPWSNDKGRFVLAKDKFQCPPTWVNCSDWMVDMEGDVDAEGWRYAFSFGTSPENYSSDSGSVKYVRRRKWLRMRRRKKAVSQRLDVPYAVEEHEQTVLTKLQVLFGLKTDREKLFELKRLVNESHHAHQQLLNESEDAKQSKSRSLSVSEASLHGGIDKFLTAANIWGYVVDLCNSFEYQRNQTAAVEIAAPMLKEGISDAHRQDMSTIVVNVMRQRKFFSHRRLILELDLMGPNMLPNK